MGINNQVPIFIAPDLNQSDMVGAVNQNFQEIYGNFNPLVISDGKNNRIQIGKLPDGTYGIVVTAPGYNVIDVFN